MEKGRLLAVGPLALLVGLAVFAQGGVPTLKKVKEHDRPVPGQTFDDLTGDRRWIADVRSAGGKPTGVVDMERMKVVKNFKTGLSRLVYLVLVKAGWVLKRLFPHLHINEDQMAKVLPDATFLDTGSPRISTTL